MTHFWYEAARVAGFIALLVITWSGGLLAADWLHHWLSERRRDRPE